MSSEPVGSGINTITKLHNKSKTNILIEAGVFITPAWLKFIRRAVDAQGRIMSISKTRCS